jgi:hypothetical protein
MTAAKTRKQVDEALTFTQVETALWKSLSDYSHKREHVYERICYVIREARVNVLDSLKQNERDVAAGIYKDSVAASVACFVGSIATLATDGPDDKVQRAVIRWFSVRGISI